MSTYVLIHGSWAGAWCWDKVIPLLEKQGHKVVAPDLPSHGNDKTPISAITLQSYVERVCKTLDSQSEPVILVGHSHGGVVITQTAEYRPRKIKMLVYLCAYLPGNGESLLDWAQQDSEQLVLQNLVFTEDHSYATVKEEAFRECFYGDCSENDVARARSLQVPEPMSSPMTPVSITELNFGRVPRVYIECLRDNAISPSLQKRMYTAVPCQKVISMDTSHSPYFAAPEMLVTHLISLEEVVPVEG